MGFLAFAPHGIDSGELENLLAERGFETVGDIVGVREEPGGWLVEVEGDPAGLPESVMRFTTFDEFQEHVTPYRIAMLDEVAAPGSVLNKVLDLLDAEFCASCDIAYPLAGEEGWGGICDHCSVRRVSDAIRAADVP